MGAVLLEPLGPVEVVHDVEAVVEDAVLDDAGDGRDAGVDHCEEEAQLGVALVAAADDGDPEPLAEGLQQADQQQRLGRVAGDQVVGAARAVRGEALGHAEKTLGDVEREIEQIDAKVPARSSNQPGSRSCCSASGRSSRRSRRSRQRPAPSEWRWRPSPRTWAARRGRPGAAGCAGR